MSVAERSAGEKAKSGGIGETIKVVIQALLIALVFRTFLYHPFNIPSGSMEPTLLIGEVIFVGLEESVRTMRAVIYEARAKDGMAAE